MRARSISRIRNLFALNRFPGYDRFEDATRFTYGVDWRSICPASRIEATIGQSYRLTARPTISARRHRADRPRLRHRRPHRGALPRFRLAHPPLPARQGRASRSAATRSTRRSASRATYVAARLSAAQPRHRRRRSRICRTARRCASAGASQFARFWSVFGSAVVDLTDRDEDPLSLSDGFEPVRHRLGVAYEDDCLRLGLTWRRDYRGHRRCAARQQLPVDAGVQESRAAS